MFKTDVIKFSFSERFISKWLFDIEVFLRLKNQDASIRDKIVEVPVEGLVVSKSSNIKMTGNFKILKELFLINSQYS